MAVLANHTQNQRLDARKSGRSLCRLCPRTAPDWAWAVGASRTTVRAGIVVRTTAARRHTAGEGRPRRSAPECVHRGTHAARARVPRTGCGPPPEGRRHPAAPRCGFPPDSAIHRHRCRTDVNRGTRARGWHERPFPLGPTPARCCPKVVGRAGSHAGHDVQPRSLAAGESRLAVSVPTCPATLCPRPTRVGDTGGRDRP